MYKIGEFSNLTNVSIKTLRYYDEIDLLKPSYIDDFTGYRYYTNNQIKDVNLILKLKELSLSLSEIKDFIKTKDISILRNKEREFSMKAEEIKDYIDDKKIEIVKGDHEKYIYWNGYKEVGSPIELEIKDNNVDYYVMKVNDEFFDNIFIFKEDNKYKINLHLSIRPFNEYMEYTLNYLKDYYDVITFSIDEELYGTDIFDKLKENFKTDKYTKKSIGIHNDRDFVVSYIDVIFKEDK